VYPADAFKRIRKYGTYVVAVEAPLLARYLKDITSHLESWLMRGHLQQLTLVIVEKRTKEVLERWTFKIESNDAIVDGLQCALTRHVILSRT
jgi:mitotic spindle assembly checkpoint protein MAD2